MFLLCVYLLTGEVISEKDRCKKCEGKKVVKDVKILEVHVDKGMKHGQKITFGGEADQAPGVEPGDIVLVLQEKEHEVHEGVSELCSLSFCDLWHFLGLKSKADGEFSPLVASKVLKFK